MVGVKKLNGSLKKENMLVCKCKNRSALSLFQFGSIKTERIKIQKIKKNNLKSIPVFLKRIKYIGRVTNTGACEVEKINTTKNSCQ
jgi:hypothetical protein